MFHDQLGDHLRSNREYDLELAVDSTVADLGQAEVFLHWMDVAYVWEREQQELRTSNAKTN